MPMPDPREGLSVSKFWKALRRRKFYFLIPVALLTAGVVFFTLRMPKRYRAQALIVAQPNTTQYYIRDQGAPAINVQEQMYTIRGTLFSRPVLEAVVRGLDLYGGSGSNGIDAAIDELRSRISVQVEAPDAFAVRFEGEDPEQAMRVTNRLADLFVQRASDIRGKGVADAAALLETEIDRLRQQLNSQEQSLRAYRQKATSDLPEHMAADLRMLENVQQQLQGLSGKITEEQARRSAALTEMAELEKAGVLDAPQPPPPPPGGSDAALETLRLRLRELRARYTPKHPEIIRTEEEIRALEKAAVKPQASPRPNEPSPTRLRYLALKAELGSIDQRLRGYQKEQAALANQLKTYESRIRTAPQYEREMAERIRDVDFTWSQYEELVRKRQQLNIDQEAAKNSRSTVFKVAEPARLPDAPAGFQPRRIILLGFLASVGLGLLAVLAAEQMDTSFTTVEEFQAFVNLPIWSVIPHISNRTLAKAVRSKNGHHARGALYAGGQISSLQIRQWRHNRVVALSAPESVPAEQYGIAALKVRRWMEQSGARMLVVTSSSGGEGKSLTSLNLSLALSSSTEEPVLLLDADLRRPRIHQYFGFQPNQGFSDLLARGDNLASCVVKIGNLHIVPGGSPPLNPLGLLTSRRAQDVFARLRKEFRFVVLDTPPIMPIVDSHILANVADGVLIVVRARVTRRELFRRAVETLNASNVLGVLLNDIEYRDTRYAYVYKYYQEHYLGRG